VTWWAVDIGGTKIAAARVDEGGGIQGEPVVLSTPAGHGSDAVLAQAVNALARLDPSGVEGVGISSAGVIDSSRGTVIGATESIAGWAGTELAAGIGRAVGLPATAIGDGHAFALGEAVYGEAAGHRSAVVLAVGTGVGGSYVRDRVPLQGSHWASGHFGHVPVPQAMGLPCYCGKTGHLEAIGSGAGMHRWYLANSGDPEVSSARQVVARVDHDAVAAAAVALSAAAVGEAAAGLANAFDPDVVVIAGGVSQAGSRWQEPMRSAFAAGLIPALQEISLLVSHAGGWLALRGAVHYARAQGNVE
jgi:glucokinase